MMKIMIMIIVMIIIITITIQTERKEEKIKRGFPRVSSGPLPSIQIMPGASVDISLQDFQCVS